MLKAKTLTEDQTRLSDLGPGEIAVFLETDSIWNHGETVQRFFDDLVLLGENDGWREWFAKDQDENPAIRVLTKDEELVVS